MKFKCNCNMKTKLAGGGCQKCNTEYALGLFPQPKELREQMEDYEFSPDQAFFISSEIVQPLMSFICTLNDKIEEMAKVI